MKTGWNAYDGKKLHGFPFVDTEKNLHFDSVSIYTPLDIPLYWEYQLRTATKGLVCYYKS